MDVSSNSGGIPLGGGDLYGDCALAEANIDLDGVVGAKLFDGGKFPDTIRIYAQKALVDGAKELNAEMVVDVTTQYTVSSPTFFSFGHHEVYLEGIALVPKNC